MSGPMLSSILAALSLVAVFVTSQADNQVRLMQPKKLVQKIGHQGIINQRPALFGKPIYGRSIQTRLYVPPDGERLGCSELSPPKEAMPTAFLLFRGNCSFVSKVRRAEAAGASVVIIINTPGNLPAMMDDGSGSSVTTPALIIESGVGEEIVDFYEKNPDTVIEVSMAFSMQTEKVNYKLWTSCVDGKSVEFKRVFADMNNLLEKKLTFEPYYFVVDGSEYGCAGSNACGNQCTNGGRYCAVDPDRDTTRGITGKEVVEENMRQMCVADIARQKENMGLWWSYTNSFYNNCVTNEKVDRECFLATIKGIDGITADEVDTCVLDAGGIGEDKGSNQRIDAELALKSENSIYMLPTVLVNGDTYYGSLSCPAPLDLSHCDVMAHICRAFKDGFEPVLCAPSKGCAIGQTRDACNRCLDIGSKDAITDSAKCPVAEQVGITSWTMMSTVLVFLSVLLAAAFLYHRHSTAKMNDELRNIMSQYVPLSNENSERARLVDSTIDSVNSYTS